MSVLTIDCGTTNCRVYLLTDSGQLLDKRTRRIGASDVATAGTAEPLRLALQEMIADITVGNNERISAIFSSGMITSEIGLRELPHLSAPCGLQELAGGLTRISGLNLTVDPIPVYFVRGVKNNVSIRPDEIFSRVGELDFMRGEEAQIMGLLNSGLLENTGTVLVLSSHSKFIPVQNGKIQGSLTTASGQMYAAILEHTFVGKSVHAQQVCVPEKAFFDTELINCAAAIVQEGGVARCMMYPRFLDVLADTDWWQRKLFFEACIAAEDMRSLKELERFGETVLENFVLVGQPRRCKLYQHLLHQEFPGSSIRCICENEEVDRLSIQGILAIAKYCGLLS